MAINSPQECGICNAEYDEEEFSPRVLPCFHTLCFDCINNLIARNSKSCPICRQAFTARTARDMSVNMALLDLVNLVKGMKKKIAQEEPSASPLSLNEVKRHTEIMSNELLDHCHQTEEEINRILHNSTQIRNQFLQANICVANNILKEINDIKTMNENRIGFLDEYIRRLESQKEDLVVKKKQVQEAKTQLTASKTFREAGKIADEIEGMKPAILDFKDLVPSEDTTRSQLEKVSKRTCDRISAINDAVKEAKSDAMLEYVPEINQMRIQEVIPQQRTVRERSQAPVLTMSALRLSPRKPENLNKDPLITVQSLRNMTPSIRESIESGRLYVTHTYLGELLHAKITLQENKLCLHVLSQQTPPEYSSILQHIDVMTMIDPSSRRVFLDFGTEEETKFRILIDLTPQSKKADNFMALSLGQLGPNYKGSQILDVFNKGNAWERVHCGDYERNDGSGGKEVVAGTWMEEGGVFTRPWLAGSVHGWWFGGREATAAQFFIVTKNSPNLSLPTVFGRVVSGLNLLQNALETYHESELCKFKVRDCGIVLHL